MQGLPEHWVAMIQAIKPKQTISPNARRKQEMSIDLDRETFHANSTLAIQLSCRVAEEIQLFSRKSATDSKLDHYFPCRA